MDNRVAVCAYGHDCTGVHTRQIQAARATPIDSATPKTKARTAAFVEAQATSPKPSVATSAAQAFADHISWSGAPRVRAKRTGWLRLSARSTLGPPVMPPRAIALRLSSPGLTAARARPS